MKPYFIAVLAAFLISIHDINAQQFSWAYGEGGLGTDVATAITHDNQGNVYVTGNVAGGVAFGNSFIGGTVYEVFLAKYTPDGSLIWVKSYGGLNNDKATGIAYSGDAIYLCGFFEGNAVFGNTTLTAVGGADIFVVKMDLDGNVLWAKQAGGVNSEIANGIAADFQGNIYVCGTYRGSLTIGDSVLTTTNSSVESFVFSFSSDGNYRWAKSTKGNSNNTAMSIAANPLGGVVVCGYFGVRINFDSIQLTTPSPSYDVYIVSYSSNGELKWVHRAGSGAEDQGYAVACDGDGNAYVVGYYGGEIKFDNITLAFSGYNDAFVAKYNNAGAVLWAKGVGGGSIDFATSVAVDENNNCYIGGVFDKYAFFEGVQVTAPDENIFIAGYDKEGNFRFVKSAGGVQTDAVLGITVINNRAFLAGYYWFTCYFDNIGVPMADNSDLFVAAYDIPQISAIDEVSNLKLVLYPNPVTNIISVNSETPVKHICITDISGKTVYSAYTENTHYDIDVSALASGIYNMATSAGNSRFVKQ